MQIIDRIPYEPNGKDVAITFALVEIFINEPSGGIPVFPLWAGEAIGERVSEEERFVLPFCQKFFLSTQFYRLVV